MKKLFLILTIALTVMQLKAQQSIDANQMEQVIANPQAQIIDVRTPEEFKEGHLPNAENLDWKDQAAFLGQINDLNQNEPVYVYCLSGGRSQQAATLLAERGFTVHNYQAGTTDGEIQTNLKSVIKMGRQRLVLEWKNMIVLLPRLIWF